MAWKSTGYMSHCHPEYTSVLSSGPSGTSLRQSLGTLVVMVVVMVVMVMIVVMMMVVMGVVMGVVMMVVVIATAVVLQMGRR